MRRLLVTAATVVIALGMVPATASADAPRDHGWWTVTNPIPAPPDVPAQGLLVQAGGGGAPTAIAALLYELEPGATASTLTLTVTPNSLTTPSATLQLCRLLQPINHPEQGGPMGDAPPSDCAHKVTAAPAADGKSYQFQVSDLVADKLVAVAILPTGPTDRVVLDQPDANSLATQQGSADTTPPAGDTSGGPSPPATDSFAGAPFQSAGASPSLADSLPGAAVAGPSSVSPPPAAAPPNTGGGTGTFVPAVAAAPEKATPLLVVLFIIAGLGGAALWLYAGRQRPDAVVS